MRTRSPSSSAWITALFFTAAMIIAAGCYVGAVDANSERGNASTAGASTAFVPADAAEQPDLPPGAGPYSGPGPAAEKPPTTPPDAGGTQDASSPPPTDGGNDA